MEEDEKVIADILIVIASLSGAFLLIGTVILLCSRLRSYKKCCWSCCNIFDEESGSGTISRASSQQSSISVISTNADQSTSQSQATPQEEFFEGTLISFESEEDVAVPIARNRNISPPPTNAWNVIRSYVTKKPELVNHGRFRDHDYHLHRSIPSHGSTHTQQQNYSVLQLNFNKTNSATEGPLSNQRSSIRSNKSLTSNHTQQPKSLSKPNKTYASATFNGNLIKLPVSVIKPHGLPSRRNSKTTRKAVTPIPVPQPNKLLSTSNHLILAVDATPQRIGGYVINLQKNVIQYYSLHSNEMPWILRNRSSRGNPTEFEMKNLFCSLLLWDDLILARKKFEIYTDNSAIIGNSKYGQRVRDYLSHFTNCVGVEILNKHRMYVNRSRHTQDFNKFIKPADSLSRTRVSDFELALRKHYPTMGFQSITNFKKVKETAIYWTKNVCPDCGFHIQITGSFKIRHKNYH